VIADGAVWGRTLALRALLGPAIVLAEPSHGCGSLPNLGDSWEIAAPAQEGFNPEGICTLGSRLAALKGADPHGVVVVRHGTPVYEAYFPGDDQRWPEHHWNEPFPEMAHDARTKHDLQSITTSVTALLVGIAIDLGRLKTLDAPMSRFFLPIPTFAQRRSCASPCGIC